MFGQAASKYFQFGGKRRQSIEMEKRKQDQGGQHKERAVGNPGDASAVFPKESKHHVEKETTQISGFPNPVFINRK
ncbi:hypothetical protein TNIN_476451 [Trichonephila inaurata madagascariensis]|uniref:Uncharacterized protein n=1 Tax=Trichonephila inaurata madagascariensis TaxID=2747483 RepID=A0A8X6XZP5_9ARAC|nr:hypothetical protein TNIN_476451 [Trichonephila inaurata madagascariensis]